MDCTVCWHVHEGLCTAKLCECRRSTPLSPSSGILFGTYVVPLPKSDQKSMDLRDIGLRNLVTYREY